VHPPLPPTTLRSTTCKLKYATGYILVLNLHLDELLACCQEQLTNGRGILHFLAEAEDSKVNDAIPLLKFLTHTQPNINLKDGQDQTPLHMALMKRRKERALILIEAEGSDALSKDLFERTAVHWACRFGYADILHKCLTKLNNHEVVNGRTRGGETPLHWAAQDGHLECVKLLVEAKASVLVKSERGETPMNLAGNNVALLNYLAKALEAETKGLEEKKMSTAASECTSVHVKVINGTNKRQIRYAY